MPLLLAGLEGGHEVEFCAMALAEILDEIRFAVAEGEPLTVHLVLIVAQADEIAAEEEAELAGWLDDILVSEGAPVAATAPLFRTERNISLHDYLSTTRLQLDQFSPEDDEPKKC